MSTVHEIICIQCPVACRVKVGVSGTGQIEEVSGHKCKEGKKYAPQEYESPRRVLTTTVRTEGSKRPVLPVRSLGTVPKGLLKQCVEFLAGKTVKPALSRGDVVVHDILGTGSDIICTDDFRA